jgi:hypothetical protein
MADSLKEPPFGFEAVVLQHFQLKRGHICRTVLSWLQDVRSRAWLPSPCPAC